MTITVANIALTNTWDYWRTRTNELAYAMSTYAVTTNSNTATGNAAITGTFSANVLTANAINVGGTNTVNTLALISNTLVTNVGTITTLTSNIANVTTLNSNAINANVFSGNTANITSISSNALTINVATITTVNATTLNVNNINANVYSGNIITGNVGTFTSYVKVGNSTVNATITGANSVQQSNGGYYYNANGSYVYINLTSSVPGSNTQIPFNDSATSNASADFTFNKTTKTVYAANAIQIGNSLTSYANNTTSGNSTVTLDSFLLTTYRSAEYLISIKDTTANGYQLSKLLMIHDGTTAYITEYGIITTNASLASFTATTNSTAAILQITPIAATADIKTTRTLMSI